MATVRANGVALRVNRYRIGPDDDRQPAVVFIHGLGIVDHSGLSFTLGMPLAGDADVVLYALRGHGHSEVPPAGYRLDDHVADLVALLDAQALPAPVHLVGCSYGGGVALLAALRHPGRVATLFLLDPLVPSAGWTDVIAPMLESAAAGLRNGSSVEDTMATLGVTSRRKAAAVRERARRLLLGTTVLDDLRHELSLGPADLARIACPVFALFGEGSVMYPRAPVLQDHLPALTLHTIPDADHLQVFGHTAEIGRRIRQHVGLPDAGPRRATTAATP